jgi:O-succinylbenzoic acid--CoA ligase
VLAGPDETWGSVLTAYVSAPTSPEGVFLDEVETILGRAARPQRVVTVPAIPHSPNGKPDREALMRVANDT